jgi:hypothetical protein
MVMAEEHSRDPQGLTVVTQERLPLMARAHAGFNRVRIPLLIAAVIFGVYFLSNSSPLQWYKHYVYQAEAFLDGRVDIEGFPDYYQDIVEYEGAYYLHFPPMPAVVLVPAVAIWGEDTDQARISMAIGAINVALAWVLLGRLGVGGRKRWLLTALFGLGTVHWEVATHGTTWFFAEIVAVFFVLLSLSEHFGRRRAFLVGLLLGFAVMSRLPIVFGGIFFLFALSLDEGFPRRPLLFLAGLAVPVALLGVYNVLRFGDPLDTGYFAHTYASYFAADIDRYGFYNLHYIPSHLYTMLLRAPELIDHFPFLRPSPVGMSIVLVTPAVLYALRARCSEAANRWLGLAIIAILLPTMLWFSTGWVQFGYRYSLDFMPFLLILISAGMGRDLSRWAIAAVALSIGVNLWGTLWSVHLGW